MNLSKLNLSFSALFIVLLRDMLVTADTIYLKCDEFDRPSSPEGQELQDIYCTITDLVVSHGQEVKVQTFSGFRTSTIKTMAFYGSTLLYIPYKLFEVYPNLNSFDVSYSGIVEITRNAFAGASSLSFLNMSHNNLTEVATSVFVGATTLVLIDLSFNKIRVINENAFKGLQILNRVIVSGNVIESLPKDLFSENFNLQTFAADNNLIESLDPAFFSKLTRLREVNLVNNRLTTIDPDLFKYNLNMDSLWLSDNKLEKFEVVFGNFLYRLDISNNRIESIVLNTTKILVANSNNISSISFLSPTFAEKLYLSKNNITNIQNITNCSSLSELDLSYNNIGIIDTKTFANLTRLRRLFLNHTHLSGLNYGTFSKQVNLEVLDLSYNNLTKINLDTFVPYLQRINEFYIDGNNLTEINGRVLLSYAFPQLATLGLSNNNFNCTYLHQILSPISLQSKIKLHIDPEDPKDVASTHVRGIACHSKEDSTPAASKENQEVSAIEKLRVHERQLEQHLLLMKCFVISIAVISLSFVLFKLIQLIKRRQQPLVRNIIFRSTATVNTLQTGMDS